MKKFNNFVNESKFFPDAKNLTDEEFEKDMHEKVRNLESVDDIYEYIKAMSMGFHFPFNPPEPLRTVLREKMEEFKNEGEFKNIEYWYNKVSGEFEPTPPLPPGAMY